MVLVLAMMLYNSVKRGLGFVLMYITTGKQKIQLKFNICMPDILTEDKNRMM